MVKGKNTPDTTCGEKLIMHLVHKILFAYLFDFKDN
jgi:hypothetical protein